VNDVSLPTSGYLGFSSHTGDASDNHDILSVSTSAVTNAHENPKKVESLSSSSSSSSSSYSHESSHKKSSDSGSSGWGWFLFILGKICFSFLVYALTYIKKISGCIGCWCRCIWSTSLHEGKREEIVQKILTKKIKIVRVFFFQTLRWALNS
jgi:hypothetical protein